MKNQSIILTIILGIISLTSCNNNNKEVTPSNNNTIIEEPIVWKTPTTYLNPTNYTYFSEIDYVKNCKNNKTGTFTSKQFVTRNLSTGYFNNVKDTVDINTYIITISPDPNSSKRYKVTRTWVSYEKTIVQNIQVAREGQSLIKYKDVIYQNTDLSGNIF